MRIVFLLILFLVSPLALADTTAPPVSRQWLEILDKTVKANNNQIPVDPLITTAVDLAGKGQAFQAPTSATEKLYSEAFIKMRSLATQLYATPEGRKAYLKVFNPDFLKRLSEQLSFADGAARANLQNQSFKPTDLPQLLEHVHHNMTYVLNKEPDFTKNYLAFGPEDDIHFYENIVGKNGLFKFVAGAANGQTVRVNFTEKMAQSALLTQWVIEGNKELGIPALGVHHPVSQGLIILQFSGMEHDSTHGLQWYLKPVAHMNQLIEKHQPDALIPGSKTYGLFNPDFVKAARPKLDNEMSGFYISNYFERGNEAQINAAADFIDDIRHGRSVVRGVDNSVKWSEKLAPAFAKGGKLQWLQEGTNRRDIVKTYLRDDMGQVANHLWKLDDSKIFPESMYTYMNGQFDPASDVVKLHNINEVLASGKLTKAEIQAAAEQVAQIDANWQRTIGKLREEKGLDALTEEFPYLKAAIARYEGDPKNGVTGEKTIAERHIRVSIPTFSCDQYFKALPVK